MTDDFYDEMFKKIRNFREIVELPVFSCIKESDWKEMPKR